MNLKTTIVLLILVAAGAVCYWFGPAMPGLPETEPAPMVDAGTQKILEELQPEELRQIEIRHGGQVVTLQSGDGEVWTLPGNWPTRKPEVEQLVDLLTHLRARFAPEPVGDDIEKTLAEHGLNHPAVTVTLQTGERSYTLAFGEKDEGQTNRFSRPTYLRLGVGSGESVEWKPEILRLAPGLVARLSHPLDYYQQRRLFPSERVAQSDTSESSTRVSRLVARDLSVEGKEEGTRYEMTRTGSGDSATWELKEPVKDRIDPDRLNDILQAVPDIWAEQFVTKPAKDLAEYGLKEPEQVLRVVTPEGDTRTLLIGKVSQTKVRREMRQPPPTGLPTPPMPEFIHEEYRYAKLDRNDQVFEIKADRLKDIFVPVKDLRDPRLARFETNDVQRIELTHNGQTIELVKKDSQWRLEKPVEADAENSKVTELLDRISGLRTSDNDVIDSTDPKEYGLDKPAVTVRLTIEKKEDGDAAKETKTITLELGKHDTEAKKVYVQVEPWARVNVVDDGVLTLAERPALAYRGRRILDFVAGDLGEIDVEHGDDSYVLKKIDDTWRLTKPVDVAADTTKVRDLADELGRFETTDYVNDKPTPEQLEKEYGLARPALSVKLAFTEKDRPAKTLLIGKEREGKDEYFARLADAPAVFVVTRKLHDDLARSSLAYRPLDLWTLPEADIARLQIERQGESAYQLQRDGDAWKLTGPFETIVDRQPVEAMLKELATLRAERFEAHTARDLADYGLQQPFLKVTVEQKKEGEEKKEPAKPHVLLIGKPTEAGAGSRFARVDGDDGVFVLASSVVLPLNRGALDLLDRRLLSLDTNEIQQIRTTGKDDLTLQKKDKDWQVTAAGLTFKPDRNALTTALDVWANLEALSFAAYGDKVDWAKYSLEKPAATVTVTARTGDNQTTSHTLALGDLVPDGGGDRYARLDKSPGVVVLPAGTAADLARTYLDYVDRTLLHFDPSAVRAISRRMGDDDLEIVRRDDGWFLTSPAEHRADGSTLESLVGQLSDLRALRVAAYPVKDEKAFGLDSPAAVLTIRLGDDNKDERILRIGKAVDDTDRFVQVEGSEVVGVLSGSLAEKLLAPPLAFRDRTLARFVDADRATMERGDRKAVFSKVAGTWKLTEPVEANAEQLDLEDFINAVARLRAERLVAEKPSDLKEYGLDKPLVRWQFLDGDKVVLDLLVGDPEKKDDAGASGRYAKLAEGDLVFLLDPKLTGRAIAEYRSRTLWPSLDAAQVERVDFRYPKNPFSLVKVGSGWQVEDKPQLQVRTEAVNDTLAALAGLKAERTVVDAGADWKLYGLQPPELEVEVRLPTGKRVLQIGRPEGESQRRYARVVDGDRDDVFVISAADAGKIVRPLKAFTETGS